MSGTENKRPNFIIWERPSYPGLIYTAGAAVVVPHRKEFGRPWAKTYAFWSKGMVRFIWPRKEFLLNSRYIAHNFLHDEYFRSKVKRLRLLNQKLADAKNKLGKTDLRKITDREFLRLNANFQKIYLDWWGWAQVAEPAAAGLELYLKKNLKLTAEELSTLTTPTKKSYTMEEEEEIFSLALAYKKTKKIPSSRLRKHAQKYFWLNNGYDHTYFLKPEYFSVKIKEVAGKMSVQQIKDSLENNKKRLILANIKINNLAKKLRISAPIRKAIKMIDWLADFQDKRKALSLEANYYLDEIIKELSRRSGWSYDLIRYLVPSEYTTVLKNQFSLVSLKERQKFMGIIYTDQGVKLYFGETARKREVQLLGQISDVSINEIEGTRAMGGKIIGRARVILKKADINQMKSGEILVTTMTSPDFILAMKKAAAIVTDEGGITCHAAIISRELNIPCVIGTKIATRIFKDGDLVEVNANHGVVKKL